MTDKAFTLTLKASDLKEIIKHDKLDFEGKEYVSIATATKVGVDYIVKNFASLEQENASLREEIERLKKEREWIPVSDRLPDVLGIFHESDYVLVYWEEVNETLVCWYNHKEVSWFVATHRANSLRIDPSKITHWRPLPPKP